MKNIRSICKKILGKLKQPALTPLIPYEGKYQHTVREQLPLIRDRGVKQGRQKVRVFGQALRIFYFIILFAGINGTIIKAQDSCQVALMQASEAFDKGMYEDVIKLLGKRVDQCSYTKESRMQALKILAASYSELDDVELAEATTKKFIKLSPVYTLQGIDPYSFAKTFKRFSVLPLFSFGLSTGLKRSYFDVVKRYRIWDVKNYNSNYSVSDKFELNLNVQWYALNRFSLGAEIGISGISCTKNVNYGDSYKLSYSEDLIELKAPIYLEYNVLKKKNFSAGLLSGVYAYKYTNINYSYNLSYDGTTNKGNGFVSSGRNLKGIGLIEGLKLSYHVNRLSFSLQPRYCFNTTLYNNPSERYSNSDFNMSTLYVDDDVKLKQLEFLFGVSYTFSYKIKNKYH